MPYNGSGVYSPPSNSWAPAVATTTISSSDWNTLRADIATALSTAICKDGQTTVTANLPMATYRHTGVGNAQALTDYATADQVVDNALCYGGASAAGTDTYAVNLAVSPGAYAAGQRYSFKADVANTGACTINFNTIGAASIKNMDGTDPATNSIIANQIVELEYDGTNMILLNPAYNSVQTLGTVEANKVITANASGHVNRDTSSSSKNSFYDNGVVRNGVFGNTNGDFGLYDFTNSRELFFYRPTPNTVTIEPPIIARGDITTDAITAETTNGDLNLARNGTGDITVDSVPIYGLVILDTPVQLVSTSTPAGFTTLDMSTVYAAAATAGATKAILRVVLESSSTSGATSRVALRKTGSGISDAISEVVQYRHSGPSATDYSYAINTTTVNLDSNSDFDYYYSDTSTSPQLYIYIDGYYV